MGIRYNLVTEETVERRWDCPRCQAHGVVTMRAHGESGWRRKGWFTSRDDMEGEMREDARWSVQRDAERMMGLMRCPACRQRAPRAVMWSVVRGVLPLLAGLVMAIGAVTLLALFTGMIGIYLSPLILGGCIWFALSDEIRRWRTAKRTRVAALRPGQPVLPVAIARTVPVARPSQPPARPLEPLASSAPAMVKATDVSDGPRFLKD